MGRQAWFLNWFWSSFLYINAKKKIIIDSTYFKNFFPLSGLSFVARYFVALCSNTHNKLKFSHVLLTFQATARYCCDLQTKSNMFCIIRAPSQTQSQRIVIHLARNADKGGGVLMSIILPNLNHSFISPVPVPFPVPVPDSGSGSGSGFPGFPYTRPDPLRLRSLQNSTWRAAISTIAPSKTALFGCLVHGRWKNGLATRPKGKMSHSHGGPR